MCGTLEVGIWYIYEEGSLGICFHGQSDQVSWIDDTGLSDDENTNIFESEEHCDVWRGRETANKKETEKETKS